jgi:hypothetical protein
MMRKNEVNNLVHVNMRVAHAVSESLTPSCYQDCCVNQTVLFTSQFRLPSGVFSKQVCTVVPGLMI